MINLDTHIVVHAVNGGLRPAEQDLLSRNQWFISSMVLWELAKLVQLGCVSLDLDGHQLTQILSMVHVLPIDLAVARASTNLDFSSDPADEIIAATSIVYEVPLLTRDRVIRRSKMVPLAA